MVFAVNAAMHCTRAITFAQSAARNGNSSFHHAALAHTNGRESKTEARTTSAVGTRHDAAASSAVRAAGAGDVLPSDAALDFSDERPSRDVCHRVFVFWHRRAGHVVGDAELDCARNSRARSGRRP